MSGKAIDDSDPAGVVRRALLQDIFSTLEQLWTVANCRQPGSGRYEHQAVCLVLGVEEMDRALRALHEILWREWAGASLEQQQADLFLYLRDMGEEGAATLAEPSDGLFHSFAPDSATKEHLASFRSNLSILLALLRNQSGLQHRRVIPQENDGRMKQVLQILRQQYARPRVTLQELAGKVGVSERHLGRLFQRSMGQSFHSYLRELRIDRAVALLCESAYDVKGVAGMAGYSDTSYFIRDFREQLGCTPLEFRAKSQRLQKLLLVSPFSE